MFQCSVQGRLETQNNYRVHGVNQGVGVNNQNDLRRTKWNIILEIKGLYVRFFTILVHNFRTQITQNFAPTSRNLHKVVTFELRAQNGNNEDIVSTKPAIQAQILKCEFHPTAKRPLQVLNARTEFVQNLNPSRFLMQIV
jgi:hypothetical protein